MQSQIQDLTTAIQSSIRDIGNIQQRTSRSSLPPRTEKRKRRASIRAAKQLRATTAVSDEESSPRSRRIARGGQVDHDYHDYAMVPPRHLKDTEDEQLNNPNCIPFPMKLFKILEDAAKYGFEDVVSWQPHGRACKFDNEREC